MYEQWTANVPVSGFYAMMNHCIGLIEFYLGYRYITLGKYSIMHTVGHPETTQHYSHTLPISLTLLLLFLLLLWFVEIGKHDAEIPTLLH